ncbi:conserved hypothetical protein [Clostridium botulinum D str. 1873]|uniref:Uncharacterized protein n=2 Tax=Clostridiaceae TaxID=31979 RepID=A0A9P2LL67_CLOBO|nr:hypothetical protein [Clostridium botulinum]EES91269.1 conserved hypothetical protein [Clostridium botulinum D str. 1873]
MHWIKKRKSGFIIIFTLITVSILMLIVLYSFRLEIIENGYNVQKNIALKEENDSRKREYLLTKIGRYIKANMKDDMNDITFNSILFKINENHISFEDVFAKFDNINKNILIYFPNEKGTLRCEAYFCNRNIQSNKLEFKLISIQYVNEVVYKC